MLIEYEDMSCLLDSNSFLGNRYILGKDRMKVLVSGGAFKLPVSINKIECYAQIKNIRYDGDGWPLGICYNDGQTETWCIRGYWCHMTKDISHEAIALRNIQKDFQKSFFMIRRNLPIQKKLMDIARRK